MARALVIFIPVLFATAIASNGFTADDKSVEFLLSSQNLDGGWGASKSSKSTVADTAMAMMALMRSGENFKSSTNANKMQKALEYLISRINKSDDVTLGMPDASELIGVKLGPNKDLFFATWALSEALDVPISKQNKNQALKAIKKSLAKIGKNLNAPGKYQKGRSQYFGGLLGTAVQLKAIARAISMGVLPDKKMREFLNDIDPNSINSSSGYALYDEASKLSIRYDLEMIKSMLNGRQRIFSPSKEFESALEAFHANLTKRNFISGYGSLGGEEMLSYQLISEAMRFGGIDQTDKWQQQFTDVIDRAKNPDGSIVGKHCITGTTFPTAGSLLTKKTGKKLGIKGKSSPRPQGVLRDSQFESLSQQIRHYRDTKGPKNTQHLVQLIHELSGEEKEKARIALKERMCRMNSKTLKKKLANADVEIQSAAIRAVAKTQKVEMAPDLINLLLNDDVEVCKDAIKALRMLADNNFGYNAEGSKLSKFAAQTRWQKWWDNR